MRLAGRTIGILVDPGYEDMDEMQNAGAEWVDKPALRDGNLVWGRGVADIPDFCRELIRAIEA